MRVYQIYYPVRTLGYGQRLGIWFQGCKKDCPGCISPEARNYSAGKKLDVSSLFASLPEELIIDGLTISGGEPFDQLDELYQLVRMFNMRYGDDIVIFTGYTREELRGLKSNLVGKILNSISVLIEGPYIEDLNNGVGMRGSSNQTIIVYKHYDRYRNLAVQKRELQAFRSRDRIVFVGIPPKEEKISV